MDQKLQAAIDNPGPLYTDEYRKFLARLGAEISEILGIEVLFKSNGDYTTAFVISIRFSETGSPIDRHKAERQKERYKIRLHISPMGPYFAYDMMQRDMEYRGNGTRFEWCEWSELPNAAQFFMNKITAVVADKGYTLLTWEQRDELVPGRVQKLDGYAPATVGSVLFSEI